MVVPVVARLSAAGLLPFVDLPGPAVVHLSLSLGLPFNRALLPRLAILEEPVRVAQVDLLTLARTDVPVLDALRHAVRSLGARFVLPGYYLFDHGRLLAFESGLPTPGDARRIARGTLLGLLFSALQRKASLLGRGLDLSIDDAVAKRMATSFRRALSARRAQRVGTRRARPSAPDPLRAAYELLGVSATASDQAVRKAWRKKLAAAHPDRVARDEREAARRTRRAAEINRAYEIITSHRSQTDERQSTGS